MKWHVSHVLFFFFLFLLITMQLLQKLFVCNGTFVFHLSVPLNCVSSLIYISHLHDNVAHTDAFSLVIIHMTLSDFIWHYIKVDHSLVNSNKDQRCLSAALNEDKWPEGNVMNIYTEKQKVCLNGLKSTCEDKIFSLTYHWDGFDWFSQ